MLTDCTGSPLRPAPFALSSASRRPSLFLPPPSLSPRPVDHATLSDARQGAFRFAHLLDMQLQDKVVLAILADSLELSSCTDDWLAPLSSSPSPIRTSLESTTASAASGSIASIRRTRRSALARRPSVFFSRPGPLSDSNVHAAVSLVSSVQTKSCSRSLGVRGRETRNDWTNGMNCERKLRSDTIPLLQANGSVLYLLPLL